MQFNEFQNANTIVTAARTTKLKKRRRHSSRSRTLRCESLEARRVLAAYIVTTVADTVAVDGEVSLREALQAANTNIAVNEAVAGDDGASIVDTISFAAGLSSDTISLDGVNGQLEISDSVAIFLGDAPAITIDAGGNSRVLEITGGGSSSITGLSLTGGNAERGGGVFLNSGQSLTLDGVAVIGNEATGAAATDGGGGIYNDAGTLTITNSFVDGNAATGDLGSGGGIFSLAGVVDVTDTSIQLNIANRAGGGIEATVGSTTNLTNVNLNANTAGPGGSANPGNGGGLHITGAGDATIIGGNVNDNFAASEGGGLWNGSGTLIVDGTNILRNRAAGAAADQGGGGVFNAGGTVDIDNAVIEDNVAFNGSTTATLDGSQEFPAVTTDAMGTAQFVYDPLTQTFDLDLFVTGLELVDTTDAPELVAAHIHVGGLGENGDVIINLLDTASFVEDAGGLRLELANQSFPAANLADLGSGNLYFNVHSTANPGGEIRGQLVLPTSAGSGGGILNDGGVVDVTASTLQGNVASRAGGGIEVTAGSTTTLNGVTLNSNTAGPVGFAVPGNGGALHVSGFAEVVISGGVVSNNVAANEGGGLWNSNVGILDVTGTSITGNTAVIGGGVFTQGGDVEAVRVTLTNVAPDAGPTDSGLFLTPVFTAFHDGTYDLFDVGAAATTGLERTAEDGNNADLTAEFLSAQPAGVVDSLGGGPIAPGASSSAVFVLDPASNRYYSYASMVIPSNDAFIGNEDPQMFELFDANGDLVPVGFTVPGSAVWDAGTESNTEVDAAFFDQMAADAGTVEGGTVALHPGFLGSVGNPGDTPMILGGTQLVGPLRTFGATNADFTTAEYNLLQVNIVSAGSGTTLTQVDITSNVATGDAANQGGGGIAHVSGALTITGGTISGNVANGVAGSGGGVLNLGGTVDITDTTISGNVANRAGGGIEATAGTTTNLRDVTLFQNTAGPAGSAAPGNGGGLHITGDGNATFTGGTVSENIAASEGGGLWNGSGTLIVNGSQIARNQASGAGADEGGGGVFNAGGTVEISDALIQSNRATSIVTATVSLDGSQEVPAVTTDALGTAEFVYDPATETFDLDLFVTGLELVDTTADPELVAAHIHVGALGENGPVILNLLDLGSFVEDAGGLRLQLSDVAVPASRLADLGSGNLYFNVHSSANAGGEIRGQLVLPSSLGSGGGIFNDGGTLIVTDTSISSNVANRAGGGVEATAGSTTILTNSSVFDNVAGLDGIAAPGNGGGLHITGDGNATVTNVLYSGNTAASEGGGIWNGTGTLIIDGTTFGRNFAFGNASDQGGGGVFNAGGTVEITDSSLFSNQAFNSSVTVELNGAQEVPAVTTNASGTAEFGYSPGSGRFNLDLFVSGLELEDLTDAPELTMAHIHVGAAGEEGPVVFDLLGTTDFRGEAVTFQDVVGGLQLRIFDQPFPVEHLADLASGNLYFNVHSSANPGGEIRGQLGLAMNTGSGGAILNDGGMLTVTDSSLSSNIASRAGGAIEATAGSTTILTDNSFFDNLAGPDGFAAPGNGGALHITGDGDATITGGLISGNAAANEGGGLWNGTGTMVINGTTIQFNSASGAAADQGGGGVFNNGGIVTVTNAVLLGNVADGVSGSGGGILNKGGSVTVEGSNLSNNIANRAGGGVEATADSTTTLTSVFLNANVAGPAGSAMPGNGGGLHLSGNGNATITGGSVTNNVAASEGGGLWNSVGTLLVDGTQISGNHAAGLEADQGGGGVFNAGGTVEITSATLVDNTATGGAVIALEGSQEVPAVVTDVSGTAAFQYHANSRTFDLDLFVTGLEDFDSSPDIPDLTMAHIHVGAAGQNGPVILNLLNFGALETVGNFTRAEGVLRGLRLRLSDVVLPAANVADLLSGNLYFNIHSSANPSGEIRGQLVLPASSGSGGGVLNDGGLLTVTDSTIRDNVASRAGGGVEVTATSTTILSGLVLSENVAGPIGLANPGNGGGLHISGDANVTVDQSLVSDNFAANEGGGLWNSAAGTLNVTDSTVANNASPSGAGIFNDGVAGDVMVSNSTIANNVASATGGGIATEGGTVTLNSTTIAYNSAPTGGGVTVSDGVVILSNTLVANNNAATGSDIAGTITSGGNNLISQSAGTTITAPDATDLIDVSAGIGVLADNGGPTPTIALLAGSPALNSGDAGTLTVDQRGVDRPQGAGVDIGAFESDLAPNASITLVGTDVDLAEGDTGSTTFTFTVTRTANLAGELTLNYSAVGTGNDPASANDFASGVLPTGTVTFADQQAEAVITVTVAGDTNVEPDENFTLTLSQPTNLVTFGNSSAVATIGNDDFANDVFVSIIAADGDEIEGDSGTTTFSFLVTRRGDTSVAASVDYAVTGTGTDSATADDFDAGVLPSGTVDFAAGETTQTISIGVVGDLVTENDESFTVTLSNPSASTTIETASADGIIRNDDVDPIDLTPSFSIAASDGDESEGDSGASTFTFTVTRNFNTSGPAMVQYSVVGGGANAATPNDFSGGVFPSGVVAFTDGQSTQTIDIEVNGDATVEPDETFLVTLSSPSTPAVIGDAVATGTIRNDDVTGTSASYAIATADSSRAEGNSGTTPFTFTVTRSGDTTSAGSVDFQVAGASANPTDAVDFGGSFPFGTVSFAGGETTQTVTVNVAGDTVIEPNESFSVTLLNASSGDVISTTSAIGVITNDDASVVIESRIIAPTDVTRGHVIPASTVPTAIIFRVVAPTTITAIPVGTVSLTEDVRILDGNLLDIGSYVDGIPTAEATTLGFHAIIFEPLSTDRLYIIRSSAGPNALVGPPSTNIFQPTDTNGDSLTTPSDALNVLNALASQADAVRAQGESAALLASEFQIDVNRDGNLTPVDVLMVLNVLAQQREISRDGAASGELVQSDFIAARQATLVDQAVADESLTSDSEVAQVDASDIATSLETASDESGSAEDIDSAFADDDFGNSDFAGSDSDGGTIDDSFFAESGLAASVQ